MEKDMKIVVKIKDNATKPMKKMENQSYNLSKSIRENSNAMSEMNIRWQELVSQEMQLEVATNRSAKSAKGASVEWRNLEKERSKINNISKVDEAGFIKYGSDVALEMADTFVNSAFGSEAGSMFSSTLSGVVNGLYMGLSIGNPILGAAIGGTIGLFEGLNKEFKKNDDYFKAVVEGSYNKTEEKLQNDLINGVQYFVNNQKILRSMSTSLSSPEKGEQMYENIHQYAMDTPYRTENLANDANLMISSGVDEDNVIGLIGRLGDIAEGNQEKFDILSAVYSQIQMTGKLSGAELMTMANVGFNPLAVLAEEKGQTLEDMQGLMNQGLISSQDVTHAIEVSTNEGGNHYKSTEYQSDTYEGKMAIVSEKWDYIKGGYGEGFTKERMASLEEENQWLDEYGERMRKMYEFQGTNRAKEVNENKKIELLAYEKILNSPEFIQAYESGDLDTMDMLIYQMEADKYSTWMRSEANEKIQNRYTHGVEIFRKDFGGDLEWIGINRQKENELSKGMFSDIGIGLRFNTSGGGIGTGIERNPRYSPNSIVGGVSSPSPLHEGEKVQTTYVAKSEQISAPNVQISGNNFTVREEADIYKIAVQMATYLAQNMELLFI